jgi:hypothetical protein
MGQPTMKLQISDDVVFRIIGNEAVIQNTASRVCFNLDEIGTRMWQLIWDYRSTEDVIAALLNEYKVREKQVRRDVDRLVQQLIAKGLVNIDPQEL